MSAASTFAPRVCARRRACVSRGGGARPWVAVAARPETPPARALTLTLGWAPRQTPRRVNAARRPRRGPSTLRAAAAPEPDLAPVRPDPDPDPDPDPRPARLLRLLRVNAYVELTGGVAVFLNPDAVFPGVAAGGFPGVECTQWYALTLCCVAITSFLASLGDDARDGLPVAGGMLAYHLGISLMQIRRIATGGFGVVAWGAFAVHGPLAACFAVAVAYCVEARRRETT